MLCPAVKVPAELLTVAPTVIGRHIASFLRGHFGVARTDWRAFI